MSERIAHHGVPIDNLNYQQSLQRIASLMDQDVTGNHLVTLTIPMYLEARKNPSFVHVLNEAALVVPESTGLALYSLVHRPRLERTTGKFLADYALQMCAEQGKRVALFGSRPDTRRQAFEYAKSKHPFLDVHIVHGEYSFNNDTDSGIVARNLDQLQPDLAIMAGTQIEAEYWINTWLVNTGNEVKTVGNFGQTIDIWGGKKDHPLLRKAGFEWMYRTLLDHPQKRKANRHMIIAFGKLVILDALRKVHIGKDKFE